MGPCPCHCLPCLQTATSRAVEVHELSRSVDGGGQILPLSEGMLHQLLKSALAMEIDATGGRSPGCADSR